MSTQAEQRTATPEHFFNPVNSYQLTEAIKSAIELDVFTAVSEGNTTTETIAKHCHATERGMRILCDFLTIHNFMTKRGAAYSLTADSALFLNQRSPLTSDQPSRSCLLHDYESVTLI
jgi:hypothetical protein